MKKFIIFIMKNDIIIESYTEMAINLRGINKRNKQKFKQLREDGFTIEVEESEV